VPSKKGGNDFAALFYEGNKLPHNYSVAVKNEYKTTITYLFGNKFIKFESWQTPCNLCNEKIYKAMES